MTPSTPTLHHLPPRYWRRIEPFWPSRAERRYELPCGGQLPYHNFLHALNVTRHAIDLADRCTAHGIPIEEELIIPAALWHDAGYHSDHLAAGCKTKEHYSAYLAARDLRGNASAPHWLEIHGVILATALDTPIVSNEQSVLALADLVEVTGSYERFLRANKSLRREQQLLGRELCDDEWRAQTRDVLTPLLERELRFLPVPPAPLREALDRLRRQGRANLERFLHEIF